MTEVEKAYIAGIIDGEGTITIERRSGRATSTPAVYVASTDRELLEWLESRLGGCICKRPKRSEHHKLSWDWKLRGDSALALLADVRPYLRIQRRQARARMLCEQWKLLTPRNGRYSAEQARLKQTFVRDFAAA